MYIIIYFKFRDGSIKRINNFGELYWSMRYICQYFVRNLRLLLDLIMNKCAHSKFYILYLL